MRVRNVSDVLETFFLVLFLQNYDFIFIHRFTG